MGGVTDSQTVIRRLKSGKPITPVILLLLAGLLFWQRMENEHINCYAPPEENIRQAAVNQYCFITGTYTVVSYPKRFKTLQRNLPYPGIGPYIPSSPTNEGTDVKYHMYFQWVPFVLGLQAILFTIPGFMWKSLRKDTLSRYCNCISSVNKNNSNIIKQTAKRFLANLKHQSSYSRWFITVEVLNLIVVVLAFYLSDLLLTGQFFNLGLDWISYLQTNQPDKLAIKKQNHSTNPLDLTFPKMSKCEFKKFGPGGSIINHDLLCVMTLNVYHDKVFLFLWFWFLLLIIIKSFRLFYQLIILRLKVRQYQVIFERIEPAFLDDENSQYLDKHPAFKDMTKNFLCSLGYSDWFLLKAIATTVDAKLFTEFFQDLVTQHEEQERSKINYQPKLDCVVNNPKYSKMEQGSFDEDGGGKRGMIGWKNQKAYYHENLMGTLERQNASNNAARNRQHTQSLYSNLNESLREMRQEEELMEDTPLVSQLSYKKPNFPVTQKLQSAQHLNVDTPDGNLAQEIDRNENVRDNFNEN